MTNDFLSPEHKRLDDAKTHNVPWKMWGPYLSGRQWGTVREDYSNDGNAWEAFPFEHSHARTYRWGEDGLGGICDRFGFLNFSIALWNRHDPILKERLYGLTNAQGNHGEDAKEYWWAIDGTPTHSWMQWLYRYPQAAYPYDTLLEENYHRTREEREYELADTGILAENKFFDVLVTYAKADPHDIAIKISVTNCGPDPAPLEVIPQLWLRNTWTWGRDVRKSIIEDISLLDFSEENMKMVQCTHGQLGAYTLAGQGNARLLFCDNETNFVDLYGTDTNPTRYTKDGINKRIVAGDIDAVNPAARGTKVGFWYSFNSIDPGQTVEINLRLGDHVQTNTTFQENFAELFSQRKQEADEFYSHIIAADVQGNDYQVARRAYAGLLWNKQLYRYNVSQWLEGDPVVAPASEERLLPGARNVRWKNFALADIISMPDEWEYPWFAAWDLAFHCVPLAHVDPEFAKEQLVLMCREWAMHPNGQLPAYEWEFSDVNPPVHAWAAWHVYRLDGSRDQKFLIKIFTKLLLNFSWWVNRKDSEGSGIFEGGFLGMDNIALFDRSRPLPPGFRLEQSDATSWMAFYCQQMFTIALELSRYDKTWQDSATKFLEHFLAIAHAMNSFGTRGVSLWDEEDNFYYDVLVKPNGEAEPMKVRSMVGLLPLLAVMEVPSWISVEAPEVTQHLQWLQRKRPELVDPLLINSGPDGSKALLSLVNPERLRKILERMFDVDEFLSPYGIRSMSKQVKDIEFDGGFGEQNTISYEAGESQSGMFGGNSNWRGPVWFPVNVLLSDKLRTYGKHFGDDFKIEIPAGTGHQKTLIEAADYIDQALISLFVPVDGRRPSDGTRIESSDDPLWSAHPTFSEYFDGDTGEGLGASHQTGWTALVAHLHNPFTLDINSHPVKPYDTHNMSD